MIQEIQKSAVRQLPLVREEAYKLDPTLNIDVGTQHGHSVNSVFHIYRGYSRLPDLSIFPFDSREVVSQKLSECLQA